MINFEALEQALSSLEKVGRSEITFDAGGVSVTLRLLSAEEDTEAMQFAQEVLLDEGENNLVVLNEYADHYKIGLLSYALEQVGDQSFREPYIETGEALENGKPKLIEKHEAVRRILKKWPRKLITQLAEKYRELDFAVDQEVEEAIELDPPDIDAEIQRLETKIEELKQKKARTEGVTQDVLKAGAQESVPTSLPSEPSKAEEAKPLVPTQGPPPSKVITESASAVPAEPPQRVQFDPTDSMVDTNDPDQMNMAAAAEAERWKKMRRGAKEATKQVQEESREGMVAAVPVRRSPNAAATATVAASGGGELQQAEGTIQNAPVFTMPRQELTGHSAASAARAPASQMPPVALDSAPAGEENPNFRSPRKR